MSSGVVQEGKAIITIEVQMQTLENTLTEIHNLFDSVIPRLEDESGDPSACGVQHCLTRCQQSADKLHSRIRILKDTTGLL